MADVEVTRIEVCIRQRLKMFVFQLPVYMDEAVELAVPDEEVLLKIFYHPLDFAFGSGLARMVGPLQEPGVEYHLSVVIFQSRCLMVIKQNRICTATEVSEDANQRLMSVFSILLWRGEDMEALG